MAFKFLLIDKVAQEQITIQFYNISLFMVYILPNSYYSFFSTNLPLTQKTLIYAPCTVLCAFLFKDK